MGQRPELFILLILLAHSYRAEVTNGVESKELSNCTIDDLRNINGDQQKSNKSIGPPKSFKFSNCDLPTLPNAFFVDVPNIQSLEFHHSNISSIGDFALSGMHELKKLSITNNSHLLQFESWSAHNLENLIELNLCDNGIQKLNSFALRRYSKLSSLNLAKNFITIIPVGFFDFTLSIETLDLSENQLQRMESYTFKALLRLKHLNLENNKISNIDPYAFTTTAHLETLRLNGNQIGTLDASDSTIFYNLAHLQYLNLSGNALAEYDIDDDTFHQNAALKVLDISHNSLIGLRANSLNGLKSLEVRVKVD